MSKPYEHIMVADFETLWDSAEYTLSKMTTEEYIRDDRFHAYGMGYKWLGENDVYWVDHANLPGFFNSVDWSKTAVVAQNAIFDVSIMAWRYGVHPCFIFDTLSMGRALRGAEAGNSLKKLAEWLGLPPKGNEIVLTSGLGKQLPWEIYDKVVPYCKNDVSITEQVFSHMWVNAFGIGRPFPTKELRLIDMTMRMYTQPKLLLDDAMLATAIKEERTKRETLLEKLGVANGQDLAKDGKFGDLLYKLGIDMPYKESRTQQGKMIPALAKTDPAFQALLNHDNDDVAMLCEARLKVKSTLERTRAQRLLDISTRGTLPVPLYYYGAHTGRWSAAKGQAINLQNLKRGSFLRRAIMAPDGYVCVVGDLSQIEARVLAWLAGYDALLKIFASGKDAYAQFGAQMFGIPGLTKETHPDLRQSAKGALLGAGFGLGWRSFSQQLIAGFLGAPPVVYDVAFAKKLGVTKSDVQDFVNQKSTNGRPSWLQQAMAIPRSCSDEEIITHCVAAQRIINKYRDAAVPVVEFWRLCDEALGDAVFGGGTFDYKCLRFTGGHIFLPNGMALRYPQLLYSSDGGWSYLQGAKRVKLYGGRMTENIVQALARIVMTDSMLRIQKRYSCVLTVHDEVVVLAPESEAEEAKDWVLEQMSMEPSYMPGIPLAAEGGYAVRYGEAKR